MVARLHSANLVQFQDWWLVPERCKLCAETEDDPKTFVKASQEIKIIICGAKCPPNDTVAT